MDRGRLRADLRIGLVTGGRLGDNFGRRRLFLIGVAGFTAHQRALRAGELAAPADRLRLLQGVFAAIMIPQGFGILRQAFPPDEIHKAFGLFGPVIGLSAVLGPVLGGALTDGDLFGLGWRAIFLVNVPLGLIALAGSRQAPAGVQGERAPTLDLGGAALVTSPMGLLVYPLIQGREAGWPAWTFISIAASALALAAFVALERRRERQASRRW